MRGRRAFLVLLVSIVTSNEVAATSRARPPTVRELVRGGRIAALGTLQMPADDRWTADLHIERILLTKNPSRAVRAGESIPLHLDPTWMYDAPYGTRAIWILDRADGGFAFVPLKHQATVLKLMGRGKPPRNPGPRTRLTPTSA